MAAVLHRASELRELVATLVEWRDPVGVLSVTVGVEPGAGTGGTPPWAIAVDDDLARIRRDASPVLERSLDEASLHLEELLNPVAGSRGRALYVALESGAFRRLELRTPLPTGAWVGAVAHVLPLLQALEEGRPTGLVLVSKDHVVVLESELGELSELERLDLEPWVGDWWPEMKGPSRANPLRGQHAVSQRDRYAHRIEVAYDHTRRDASETLAGLAADRHWTNAVLAGDPRTVGLLEEAVRRSGVAAIATTDANLEGLREAEAHARVEEMRVSLAADVARERARTTREAADTSAGAAGLADVLHALREARVAALVIDSGRTYEGVVEPDGTLRAPDGADAPVDLADRIVVRALDTGAEVQPVRGPAAEPLLDCGGIAARLRW